MKRSFLWQKRRYPSITFIWPMLPALFGLFLFMIGIALIMGQEPLGYVQMFNTMGTFLFEHIRVDIHDPNIAVLFGVLFGLLGLILNLVSLMAFNRTVLTMVAPDARQSLADRINRL